MLFPLILLLSYYASAAVLPTTPSLHLPTPNSTTEAPALQNYAVFPLTRNIIDELYAKVRSYAHNHNVNTVRNPEGLGFGPVLYWDFNATESDAERLERELGEDVSTFELSRWEMGLHRLTFVKIKAFMVDDSPVNVDPDNEPRNELALRTSALSEGGLLLNPPLNTSVIK